MSIPQWVPDAIFYQIFPDRFANGNPHNDPPNVMPWGAKPTKRGFQGGDLRGIIQHFDYLLDLGVNSIYLNPIFQATSNHRYNTMDYVRIDPKLGTLEDFHELIDLAHHNNMRVILDGVFNHCGRGFFAFQDVLENEEESPYVDWFHIRRFPINAYGSGKVQDYAAWWGHKSLPKLNTENPEVRRYLYDVACFWIEQGADGWRLDVPNEIDDDSFWCEFREIVKGVNPEAYLVGEIWEADPRWVGEGHFDGLMNYPFRDATIDFIGKDKIRASQFMNALESLLNTYPGDHNLAHLLTVGSHDTERLVTICGGDIKRARLVQFIQFCFPGVPHLYYGDEIGLQGGKDPDCRGAFPWNKSQWDQEQRTFVKTLIDLRHRYSALRRGEFRWLFEDDEQNVIAFSRSDDQRHIIIILNASENFTSVSLKLSEIGFSDTEDIQEVLSGKRLNINEGIIEIHIPALEGKMIVV